jgi:hypothetical protein
MSDSRQLRRAAERRTSKDARSAAQRQNSAAPSTTTGGPTGPRTPEGKAKSSLNNLRHGLTGQFRVLDYESQEEFEEVLEALRDEHQPTTATEDILVSRLAEHAWLSRRAQCLQDGAILANSPHNLGLFLRYQTANDRGFHRCLNELSKLRKERRQFESQSAPPPQQFVSQNPEEAEKKHNSAMVAELRGLIGEDYPASDADLLNILQCQMLDLCIKIDEKAAA